VEVRLLLFVIIDSITVWRPNDRIDPERFPNYRKKFILLGFISITSK